MYKKYIKQFTKIRDFDNLIKFIILILQDKKIRFLIVGAYNTLVCYIFGLFWLWIPKLSSLPFFDCWSLEWLGQ